MTLHLHICIPICMHLLPFDVIEQYIKEARWRRMQYEVIEPCLLEARGPPCMRCCDSWTRWAELDGGNECKFMKI
jgi:hypothetical protein